MTCEYFALRKDELCIPHTHTHTHWKIHFIAQQNRVRADMQNKHTMSMVDLYKIWAAQTTPHGAILEKYIFFIYHFGAIYFSHIEYPFFAYSLNLHIFQQQQRWNIPLQCTFYIWDHVSKIKILFYLCTIIT